MTLLLILLTVVPAHSAEFSREAYLPPAPYRDSIDPVRADSWPAELRGGVVVLKEYPFALKDLPLCVHLTVGHPAIKAAATEALERWNFAAVDRLGKAAFATTCAEGQKADVELLLSEESGTSGDGQMKFGEIFALKTAFPRILLLLREKEIEDFKAMLNGLGGAKAEELPGPKKRLFLEKLAAFKKVKTASIIAQTLTHELGHVLGLGHNFNDDEHSVMNYSDSFELSDYDRDGLARVFKPTAKAARAWKAQLKPH